VRRNVNATFRSPPRPVARSDSSARLRITAWRSRERARRRRRPATVDFTRKVSTGKDQRGRTRMHTLCGLLTHSSLAVTADGLPLAMAAARFWIRKKFKRTNALKGKINPTRVPIEDKESPRWFDNLRQSTELLENSARCVHISDREEVRRQRLRLRLPRSKHFSRCICGSQPRSTVSIRARGLPRNGQCND